MQKLVQEMEANGFLSLPILFLSLFTDLSFLLHPITAPSLATLTFTHSSFLPGFNPIHLTMLKDKSLSLEDVDGLFPSPVHGAISALPSPTNIS